MKQKYKIASLFSGIGGFEEGFRQANKEFEVVFASEIDKYAQKSYLSNFDGKNLKGDITKISEQTIPDHDILLAGFPCQAFSIAGKQLGFNDETKGTLFFDIKRVLKIKRPKYFLLENVKNLVSHEKSETIRTILDNLNDLGYTVDFTILNSKNFGVPQNRERTYIIGILDGEKEKFKTDSNKKIDTLKKDLNTTDFSSFNFFTNIISKSQPRSIVDILNFKESDDKYFYNKIEVQEYVSKLEINSGKNKSNSIIKLFDLPKDIHNDNERQRRVYSIYGIAPTVLARSDAAKVYIEDSKYKIRKLTPVENLRLQGFSNEFIKNLQKSDVSNTQLYKQSGNAVSPPVVASIIKELANYDTEKKKNRQFNFIDLFSGIGGFRIALEKNGGNCVFSSDIDKYARETYYENFGDKPSGDITKIDAKDIPDHDILTAGFPCQPFSLAGKRLGFLDTRGTLFFDVERIIKEKKPKAFILENVSGIVNHDKGNTLRVIENSLKNLEYDIVWKVMNSKDYGIPQNRNRWYCIGILKTENTEKKDLNLIFPNKEELQLDLESILEKNVSEVYNVSDIAIENINKHINTYIEKKDKHKVVIANNVRPSKVSFRSDGISPCLTAKMGTGGNNVPIVVSEGRKFTEKECLKLMGFPENFKIKENYGQSYKQIGNSVVVNMIDKLVSNLIEYI